MVYSVKSVHDPKLNDYYRILDSEMRLIPILNETED